jgi:hypothetical protein
VVTDKGEGIRRLIKQHGLNAVIFLGDDVSDLDMLRTHRVQQAKHSVLPNPLGSIPVMVRSGSTGSDGA